jgi:hypothetical protein
MMTGVAVPSPAGVTVPDAGCSLGPGTSPSGSSKYALKNVRQLALDGTKWPAGVFSHQHTCKRAVARVGACTRAAYADAPPSCHSTRARAETSTSCCARSGATTTSPRPTMCSVGVAYPPSNTRCANAPAGLKPAAAMQNVLRCARRQRGAHERGRANGVQRRVRRRAVDEEGWEQVRPFKLAAARASAYAHPARSADAPAQRASPPSPRPGCRCPPVSRPARTPHAPHAPEPKHALRTLSISSARA